MSYAGESQFTHLLRLRIWGKNVMREWNTEKGKVISEQLSSGIVVLLEMALKNQRGWGKIYWLSEIHQLYSVILLPLYCLTCIIGTLYPTQKISLW